MASTKIPRLFKLSCQKHLDYPTQLIDRSRYGLPLLKRCLDRLDDQERRLDLFVPDSKFYVPYLDVYPDGRVDFRNLKSEAELEAWLGDSFRPHPSDPTMVLDAKADVPCRFIFLLTASTNKPLEITPGGIRRILSYYQVMPSFLDFLYIYGSKTGDDREIVRFSGFRTEKTLVAPPKPDLQLDGLNRSGRAYQICYSFKSVALKSVAKDPKAIRNKTWKIRQAVFYHRFDIEKATQLWIAGDPLEAIQEAITEHVHPHQNHKKRYDTFSHAFKATLDTHLLNAQWATEEWRWHVQSLEEIMDNMTRHFVSIRNADAMIRWEPGALNITQEREEKIKDTLMALESNSAVLTRLRSFYRDLVNDEHFPAAERHAAKQNVKDFASRLDEYIYDTNLQTKRAHLAAQLAKDRKDILIQHLNAQNLTEQAAYTHTMWRQAKRSGIDGVIMKIITVIAGVFLPATFVATFFSSNIVKYDIDPVSGGDSPSGAEGASLAPEQISHLGLQRFFEISIPMMAVIFVLAYGWYKKERRTIDKRDGPFSKKELMV